MFNKSLLTNLTALLISIIGIFFASDLLKAIGFYALSGALTNWLAIIMLFDKIPFIYGSGVIPRQFKSFKNAIKNMLLKQFFHPKYIDAFLLHKNAENKPTADTSASLSGKVNYDVLFDKVIEVIMESQFGNMIQSFLGGKQALEPMREAFKEKMAKMVAAIWATNAHMNSTLIVQRIEQMIDARLNELMPQMIKKIIQDMIRQHLGWLVIWGGVFGAVIGGISTCMP